MKIYVDKPYYTNYDKIVMNTIVYLLQYKQGGKFMDTKELVLKVLKESGPLRPGEIAEKANIDKKEVDKAIKELKKEDLIESPKRCYYAAK